MEPKKQFGEEDGINFDEESNPKGQDGARMALLRERHAQKRYVAAYRFKVMIAFLVSVPVYAAIDYILGGHFFHSALLATTPIVAFLAGIGPPDQQT